jgi:hypothetical protein
MATFTITTDTNMNQLVGKRGNDTYNINGATLTINGDTRSDLNNFPTSGSFGAITISSTLGGQCAIDATKTWWLPVSGTNNIPPTGTVISGASSNAAGELLGVWPSLSAAPIISGTAMPLNAFLKLRSTSGSFVHTENILNNAGTIIGKVNSSTGGRRGWLEIVGAIDSTITVPRLGSFITSGDWFYIDDVTNGTSGQIVSLPAMSAVNTYYPGIWVETSASSDNFEFYVGLNTSGVVGGWTSADRGTDDRNKFVEIMSFGRMRFGCDSANRQMGFVPPPGCRIRIPNIITQTSILNNHQYNAMLLSLGNRPEFVTTAAGVVILNNIIGNWYLNLSQPYQVKIYDSAVFDSFILSEVAAALDISNFHNGVYSNLDTVPANITSCFAGGIVKDCTFGRAGTMAASDHNLVITYCNGIDFTRVKGFTYNLRTNATVYGIYATLCDNLIFNNCWSFGGSFYINASKNIIANNTLFVDRFKGNTPTTLPIYAMGIIGKSDNITISGLNVPPSQYLSAYYASPYTGWVYIDNSSNIKIRNIGTLDNPIDGGDGIAQRTGVFLNENGNSSNITLQRVYVKNLRIRFENTVNSDKNVVFENCFQHTASAAPVPTSLNSIYKGVRLPGIPATAATSVYGTHFYDSFSTSSYTGNQQLGLQGIWFNEATTETSPSVSAFFSPKSGFTSNSILTLQTSGDFVVYTWPHFVLGYTGFSNRRVDVSGTNGTLCHKFEYDIDRNDGNGFSGTWNVLDNINTSAAILSPSLGYKMKVKVTCTSANPANALNGLTWYPVTNSADSQTLYPLEVINASLYLYGLVSGSEVKVYRESDGALLAGIESTFGPSYSTFTYNYEWTGNDTTVTIIVFALNYQPVRLTGQVLGRGGLSIPIQPQIDRVYSNPN